MSRGDPRGKRQSDLWDVFDLVETVRACPAASGGTLDTDIVLDAGSANASEGHVVLDLSKGTVW